mmetsp:Transcript_62810/g.205017  ORF Transcript_62810/g.205017 Transcript_62810/m.205017 type:complete len:508 (+) Transcript_62810:757-2280(+)
MAAKFERLVETERPDGWGSIREVLSAPLQDVAGDESWLSVIGMWLLFPLNLIQGIFGGLIQALFVQLSLGFACLPGTSGAVLSDRPCIMAWLWWRYTFAALTALIANGRSRLALFMWEWEAFGKDRFWWHGEGVWCWSYTDCDKILRSEQGRKSAFGAVRACVPDLFASNILIFLPNTGSDSEWAAIRRALHMHFLDTGLEQYRTRVNQLPKLIGGDWKKPKLEDLSEVTLLQKTVAKCIFFVMFGQWITEAESEILIGWRTNATLFILPRLVQRFIGNVGIKKVKKLREDTVGLVEKYGLEHSFVAMNNSMSDRWRRTPVVKLCDEIMYVVGFAGIGGTCAACESVGSFLQVKIPAESAAEHIKWGKFDSRLKMITKYKESPEKYIKETCRLDPPVTSATGVLKEATKVMLAGKEYEMPAGLLNQYVLSMANRDSSMFEDPEVFNPDRLTLNKAVTWNGAFGAEDEDQFPRICPGRYMSIDVTTAVINHALSHTSELGVHAIRATP